MLFFFSAWTNKNEQSLDPNGVFFLGEGYCKFLTLERKYRSIELFCLLVTSTGETTNLISVLCHIPLVQASTYPHFDLLTECDTRWRFNVESVQKTPLCTSLFVGMILTPGNHFNSLPKVRYCLRRWCREGWVDINFNFPGVVPGLDTDRHLVCFQLSRSWLMKENNSHIH